MLGRLSRQNAPFTDWLREDVSYFEYYRLAASWAMELGLRFSIRKIQRRPGAKMAKIKKARTQYIERVGNLPSLRVFRTYPLCFTNFGKEHLNLFFRKYFADIHGEFRQDDWSRLDQDFSILNEVQAMPGFRYGFP